MSTWTEYIDGRIAIHAPGRWELLSSESDCQLDGGEGFHRSGIVDTEGRADTQIRSDIIRPSGTDVISNDELFCARSFRIALIRDSRRSDRARKSKD